MSKLTITCVKDSDGVYDTDHRIPIGIDDWRVILRDLAENDVDSWNLLREFHKSKGHTAYVRDVAKIRGKLRPDIIKEIDAIGAKIAERILAAI